MESGVKREQQQLQDVIEEIPDDVDVDELREFLEADELDIEADPLFRERLRRKLWAIVRDRFGSRSREGDS